jgi:hypothetical protein
MVDAVESGTARRERKWRSVAEKRRIAELTFEPGASVALECGLLTSRRKNSLGLVAKNLSERHYKYEESNWRQWRPELSGRVLSQVAVHGSHQVRH